MHLVALLLIMNESFFVRLLVRGGGAFGGESRRKGDEVEIKESRAGWQPSEEKNKSK